MRGWCVAVKSLLVFSDKNDMRRSRILLLISTLTSVRARFPVWLQLKCIAVNFMIDNSHFFWAIGLEVSHQS